MHLRDVGKYPMRLTTSQTLFEEMLLRIQTGAWPVGQAIPSERKLIQEMGVSRIALRPRIAYDPAAKPDAAAEAALHHQAHEQCFIANSVKTEVVVEAPAA